MDKIIFIFLCLFVLVIAMKQILEIFDWFFYRERNDDDTI